MIAQGIVAVALLISATSAAPSQPQKRQSPAVGAQPGPGGADLLPSYILPNVAQYSPYYPVDKYAAPPIGCFVDQVNVLERHGSRYPTSGASKNIAASVTKIKKATSYVAPEYQFIKNFTYNLGADDLIPFGARESYNAGVIAFQRYAPNSFLSLQAPFVRASSQQRVVDSATNWTAGYAAASLNTRVPNSPPLVISEAFGSNDTLDDNNCPNAPSSSSFTSAWRDAFTPPITTRLNTNAPGAGLTNSDIINLMQLCSFDSLANNKTSPWCGLFQQSEWPQYEYYGDLGKYYGTGYGNRLGPIQGVGYVNELLARLTGNRAYATNDKTQVNQTLDASDKTFPLSFPLQSRVVYADFTHDDQIAAIISAIGLKKDSAALNPTSPDPNRLWVFSRIAPFAGRVVTERIVCPAVPKPQQYVRILEDDQVQALPFCQGAQSNGLCTLENFVASQTFATGNGNGLYAQCGYQPLSS